MFWQHAVVLFWNRHNHHIIGDSIICRRNSLLILVINKFSQMPVLDNVSIIYFTDTCESLTCFHVMVFIWSMLNCLSLLLGISEHIYINSLALFSYHYLVLIGLFMDLLFSLRHCRKASYKNMFHHSCIKNCPCIFSMCHLQYFCIYLL